MNPIPAPFAVNAPLGERADRPPSYEGRGFNVHAPIRNGDGPDRNEYVTDGSMKSRESKGE